MNCPKCDGELRYRCQPWVEMESKILKSGKVSSKLKPHLGSIKRSIKTINAPEWIECLECSLEWEYDTDQRGRVILENERLAGGD